MLPYRESESEKRWTKPVFVGTLPFVTMQMQYISFIHIWPFFHLRLKLPICLKSKSFCIYLHYLWSKQRQQLLLHHLKFPQCLHCHILSCFSTTLCSSYRPSSPPHVIHILNFLILVECFDVLFDELQLSGTRVISRIRQESFGLYDWNLIDKIMCLTSGLLVLQMGSSW